MLLVLSILERYYSPRNAVVRYCPRCESDGAMLSMFTFQTSTDEVQQSIGLCFNCNHLVEFQDFPCGSTKLIEEKEAFNANW